MHTNATYCAKQVCECWFKAATNVPCNVVQWNTRKSKQQQEDFDCMIKHVQTMMHHLMWQTFAQACCIANAWRWKRCVIGEEDRHEVSLDGAELVNLTGWWLHSCLHILMQGEPSHWRDGGWPCHGLIWQWLWGRRKSCATEQRAWVCLACKDINCSKNWSSRQGERWNLAVSHSWSKKVKKLAFTLFMHQP